MNHGTGHGIMTSRTWESSWPLSPLGRSEPLDLEREREADGERDILRRPRLRDLPGLRLLGKIAEHWETKKAKFVRALLDRARRTELPPEVSPGDSNASRNLP